MPKLTMARWIARRQKKRLDESGMMKDSPQFRGKGLDFPYLAAVYG
ncbi:MAG: hypothetical protein OXP71_16405 [Candidatus Poribacteria bacterium]|nr:hypothetical protein [Candidatus Poribacteria bacterium]